MVANLAEARTHTISPDLFLKHDQTIVTAKREHEDAAAALARAKKDAKTNAVDLDAYKFIEKMRKLEPDEQAVKLRHIQQYAVWLNMPWGAQMSMLEAPKVPKANGKSRESHAAWAAGEAGLRAGREGDAASDNPHTPGSEEHAAWHAKFLAGQAERATAAKMGSTEHERPADKADATRKAAQGRKRGGRAAQVELAMGNARAHLNGDGAAH